MTTDVRELDLHEAEQVAGGKPPPPPPWLPINWLVDHGNWTPTLPTVPILVPGGP